ncbi:MAG: glycogen synthase [Gammaproteobacteria bacterium]
MTPQRILFVSAEYAPLAKVGGLADMTAGLAGFLASRGHDVRILLPHYGGRDPESIDTETTEIGLALGDDRLTVRIWKDSSAGNGPIVYRLFCPPLFGAPEVYAGGDADGLRFIALCFAAVSLPGALSWQPEIVHCHDWQTALVPVLMKDPSSSLAVHSRSVLTLHNLGYQGIFGEDLLEDAGMSQLEGVARQDAEPGQERAINLLASGIRQADALTTVSPTYAREIQTEAFGMGLDALIAEVGGKLTGILNGVDYGAWDPAADDHLVAPFSLQQPAGKRRNKVALLERLGLEASADPPVIGLVSRLVSQKGIDLVLEALPGLLEQRSFSCAFLGDGDPSYVEGLRELAVRFAGRIAFVEGYDEPLAHGIIAGSDALLVPSRYEPCGLTQLYALRYGTIPVVRATGGLADTIQHFDPVTGTGDGCVFEHADAQGLTWALSTTLDWLADSATTEQLRANAMQADFSWARQGPMYEALYASLA